MFHLNIECSKGIDELHINFSDGSISTIESNNESNNTMSTKKETKKEPKPRKSHQNKKDDFLNLDEDFGNISTEVVQKPQIDLADRPVKVDTNLQKLDI